MLDLFRDGFCICGGPFGSGMWKNLEGGGSQILQTSHLHGVLYATTYLSHPGFVRFILHYMQPRGNRRKGWTIGHGRLQTNQIYQLGMDDLKALSKILGKWEKRG